MNIFGLQADTLNKNNFDFLRLYLSLAVLWHHFYYLINVVPSVNFFNVFDPETAVRAFFVISGALIWKSATKTDSYKLFFYKRFFRIFPAYVTVLFLSVLISYFIFDAELTLILKYFLWNLTTLNFMEPCIGDVYSSHTICAQNASLWTIKIEVLYYLFILVIFYFFNKLSFYIYVFLSVFSFLLHFIFVYLGAFSLSVSIINQIPFLLFYFFLGSILNDLFKALNSWINLMFFVTLSFLYYMNEFFYPFFVVSFVFFIAYAIPVHLNVNKLGDFSYGVYIYHFPVVQLLLALGVYSYFPNNISVILTVVIVMFISFLSWHIIEKPSLNYAKKLV